MHIYAPLTALCPESWSATFVICTPFMLHATQTLNKALIHPESASRMPSRVTLSPCMAIGRDSAPGMPDCEYPLGEKGKSASHFRNVESGTCSLRCSVNQYGVHGVHAFIIIVSLACSVDNRIHDCTLSHNLAFYSIKTSTRSSLNNAGPSFTLIRWSLGCSKLRSQKIGDPKKGPNSAYFYFIKQSDSWNRLIKGKQVNDNIFNLEQQKGQVKEEEASEKCTYSGVQMGNSSTITIYDNHSGNGSKSQTTTRPSYFSIEELPSTLDEGFRFRPSYPRDEEEGDEENEDYNDDDHDNDTVRHGNGKWKPGVKEWLVLICVSIVVMMDAFDATVIIPLVSVCKYLFFSLFGHLL